MKCGRDNVSMVTGGSDRRREARVVWRLVWSGDGKGWVGEGVEGCEFVSCSSLILIFLS